MIYADYEYYSGTYAGNIPEELFTRLAVRASSYLDYYTQGKAEKNADLNEVKMCCCALVDKYAVIDAAQETAIKNMVKAHGADVTIKSETVGGYSRTMATGEEEAAAALNVAQMADKLLAQTCTAYLGHTGLLYRGGGGRRCTLPTL